MKNLLTVLVVACTLFVPATLANAQERVGVEVVYAGGKLSDMCSYPLDRTLRPGKQPDTNGIAVNAEVRLTDIVSVGYRFEHLGLRHSQFVIESVLTNGEVQRMAEPNPNAATSTVAYQEWFGSFKLPKTHSHALIVGLAKSSFEQEWSWREQGGIGKSKYGSSETGLVVGGQGRQTAGPLTFDYTGRLYPRLANTTGYKGMPSQFESVGLEIRGSAT